MMRRGSHKPLCLAEDVFRVLSSLQVGDPVPVNILIHDYVNDGIPAWVVAEREESGVLIMLTLIDESGTSCHRTAIDVFTCPAKTLGGRLYQYYPGCVHARNMFADIRQHARAMCDYWQEPRSALDPKQTRSKTDVRDFWLREN